MSEFEDRQDATPAIDTPTPAATPVSATTTTAEAVIEGAGLKAAASLSERDDLEAIAAVEGVAEPDGALGAFGPQLAPIYPEMSDAAVRADDAPLLDDALEDGIASVFAALQAAARDGEIGESDEPASTLSDDEAHDGITFRLLGELDRLWHRAA